MIDPPEEKPAKTCPMAGKGFNYCFWAKLLVAIPAIPAATLLVASLFRNHLAQMVAGGTTTFLMVYLAIMIDRMPALSGMVVKHKPD